MYTLIRPAVTALTIASLTVSFSALATLSAVAQAPAPAKQAPAQQPAAKQAPAKQSAPRAAAPAQEIPPLKQIALTDQQINAVLAAQKDLDAIVSKLPQNAPPKPEPKVIAQFEDAAKKNGFASYAEYGDVLENILLVLGGFDPKTKAYVGPEVLIKEQIAAVQADKKMPAKNKKAALDDMNAALKSPPPVIEHKGNIELVGKQFDRLAAALNQE